MHYVVSLLIVACGTVLACVVRILTSSCCQLQYVNLHTSVVSSVTMTVVITMLSVTVSTSFAQMSW